MIQKFRANNLFRPGKENDDPVRDGFKSSSKGEIKNDLDTLPTTS
jgi:hypothetical protein